MVIKLKQEKRKRKHYAINVGLKAQIVNKMAKDLKI